MTDQVDPELEKLGRQRLLQLSEWYETLRHGSDEERRALVASLREIDLLPALSTLDEDDDEVRTTAREVRIDLAKAELHRMSEKAVAAGDMDTGAKWLELALSLDADS